jgi:lipoprotein signal peptidase
MRLLRSVENVVNDAKTIPFRYQLATAIVISTVDLFGKHFLPAIYNPGISFGWGSQIAHANLIWVVAYLVFFAMVFLPQLRSYRNQILILLILGSSNLIDRLTFGAVRDYLNLLGISFNLTDVAINLYVIIIVLIEIFGKRNKT